MNSGEALLRAILIDPADDCARLVYADWLEENGQGERAEFIRVQCELAKPVGGDMDAVVEMVLAGRAEEADILYRLNNHDALKRREALRRRERELEIAIPGSTWLGDWEPNPNRYLSGGPAYDGRPGVFLSRGFVGEVHLPADYLLRHAKELFSAHPVTKIVLTDKRPDNLYGRGLVHVWYLAVDDEPEDAALLPLAIYRGLSNEARSDYYLPYPSVADALADLSRACVAYGREQAGLPSLQPGAKPG